MRMDIIEDSSSIASLPTSLPSTSSSESDSSSLTDEGEDIKARVKYNLFFEFLRRKEGQNPSAKCKLCHHTYKFTLTSKGNLLKHLQTTHPDKLRDHKEEQAKLISVTQQKFNKDGTFIPRTKEPFRNQDKILISIVRNLCGKGGLAISVVEQSWFRSFMQEVEPKFQPVSRVALNSKLNRIFEEEKKGLLADIAKSVVDKPSVTVDLWTGCDSRTFMGCTVHFIHEQQVRSHMLFFVEFPPPHTAQNIKARFEDELDNLGLTCFTIITDNAANMRCAFEMENQEVESRNVADTNEDDIDDDELDLLTLWTPCEVKVEGWLGCAAHQLQLVVLDGYQEIKSYRRVQAIFAKANAIAALSRRSSHFSYSLSKKIPKPCDTRWNSHFHLHEHLIKQCDDINKALQKPTVNRNDLVISSTHKEILSLIVDIMQYFSEATNILQAEETPTSSHVITVVDSLENALMQSRSEIASINALCQRLLTSLCRRFGYLLDSPIHKAATAIDPRVKLSFTDHHKEGKVFIFSSHDVKESIKGLIHLSPRCPQQMISTTIEQPVLAKKPKLLDFSSISDDSHSAGTMNDVEIELQVYLDQSRVDINPIKFWAERKVTPLSLLALKLLSVPCSSAPVERLFSKAGIVLSQRRTRTSSSKLEKLIFLK